MEINIADLLGGMNDVATMKLADPGLIQYYQNWDRRILWLDEPICWETVASIYQYIQYINATDLAENPQPITINIMSPGGELDVMFALYHLIKTSRVPIHTVNIGRCHSAAFIIFLAGHYRTMSPYGTFVAHEGSGVVGGSFRETKAAMAQYEKDVERMCRIIDAETDLEYDYIHRRFSEEQDWYINYDEAVEVGIIRE